MRRKWLGDLALYLPALLVAFVIWLIAKQGDTETRMVATPVRLVGVPDNVEARLVPTNTVEVNLIFPKTFLKNVLEPGVLRIPLRPEGIQAKAGMGDFRPISYPILPGMVETGELPKSVRVLGVVPESVTVEARLHAVVALIKPKAEGAPDPGFELQEVRSSPAKMDLTGPPDALTQLRAPAGHYEVDTVPVSIAGATRAVSAVANLALPAGVRPVDPQIPARVEVTADIREKVVTRIFKDVPVAYLPLRTNLKVTIQPPTTNLTVKGPRSKVEALTAESFRFVPNAVPNEAVGATNLLSFRVEAVEEGLSYDLSIEADVRTVTLLFEEKYRPTPTPAPLGESLLLLPGEVSRGLFGELQSPLGTRSAESAPAAAPTSAGTPTPAPSPTPEATPVVTSAPTSAPTSAASAPRADDRETSPRTPSSGKAARP